MERNKENIVLSFMTQNLSICTSKICVEEERVSEKSGIEGR